MTRETDSLCICVVGAGISGLAIAWYLEREAAARGASLSCTVLEQSDRAGGKILSEVVEVQAPSGDGQPGRFVVEGGPDSFLAMQKPWGVRLAEELGMTSRLIGTDQEDRTVFVVSRGRPLKLPDGIFLLAPTRFLPFLRSPLISPWGKLRMGLDLVIPARKDARDETLGGFVNRRLGREALDKIAEPLLSGIYSAEVDRQSLLATFPRFREMERKHRSLIKATRAGQSAGRSRAPAAGSRPRGGGPLGAASVPPSAFVSFADGMAELVQVLVAHLHPRVQYGRRVVGIDRLEGGTGFRVRLAAGGGAADEPDTIEVDGVVLATPAFTSAELLDGLAPNATRLLRTVRYVNSGSISLGYREDASWASVCARLKGFGILVPASEKRPINAITWSSVKFPGRAPAGHSLLRVFFGGSRSPLSFDLDDAELLAMVKGQLAEIMGIREELLFHRIHRWPRGIPQYDLGHLERVAAAEEALPEGICVTGSPYRGIGIPDCARQAADTARQLMDGLSGKGGTQWK